MSTVTNLLLQLTLTACQDYHWVDDLRTKLFPGRAPAHVTLFPAFTIRASHFSAMLRRLDAVARAPWTNPFVLESFGMRDTDNWVAICLRDQEYPRRDRLKNIVEDIKRMCVFTSLRDVCAAVNECHDRIPGKATDEPHLSVYRGPPKPADIPYFGRVMSTAELSHKVGTLVDEYSENVGRRLSVKVTGCELLQRGRVIAAFPFDSQFEEVEEHGPTGSESEEDDAESEDGASEVNTEEDSGMVCGRSCRDTLAYGSK
ncbi:hypothetical protein FB45DRAFT_898809 [Roridomyces roridus]|uniref:Uncharacterized protein n=1 Tax=Roridomyces roridus TaxID=1738132 RepID=A0AAD7CCA0_9AGAR|nr:hypothetical protein FB45DRAFT_898809 [Roridomyces roridus]